MLPRNMSLVSSPKKQEEKENHVGKTTSALAEHKPAHSWEQKLLFHVNIQQLSTILQNITIPCQNLFNLLLEHFKKEQLPLLCFSLNN